MPQRQKDAGMLASRVDRVVHPAIADPERLAALRRTGLLDSPPEEAFDRATRLATRALGTPVSLVSLVDGERQFFKSQQGLPTPYDELRETPLSHSFCQYVVATEGTLAVEDARDHPVLRTNLAIRDLNVVSYLGVPFRDAAGHVLGSFCVISDQPRVWTADDEQLLIEIAEQLRTELRLRDALGALADEVRRRQDLLAMLAHDVRSPAAAVISTVETLRRLPDPRTPIGASLLEAAERQARRICQLAESLLDGGVTGGEPEPVDLPRIIGDAVLGHRPAPRVDLEIALVTVTVDAAAVQQIVVNLVDNALKHTSGRVLVTASASADQLRLVVADEGPGMEPQALADLFRPFRRGPTAADGHGLGLYIVRMLVDGMNGHLELATAPDRGTEITVLLPTTVS